MPRLWGLCAVVALLGAGCGDGAQAGVGVNLTVDAKQVAEADRGRITMLRVTTDGAERYVATLDVAMVPDKTEVRLHYVPLVRTGELKFVIEARSADNKPIAVGKNDSVILVDGRAVAAQVELKTGASRHVGEACTGEADLCDGEGGCVDGVCCGTPCDGACQACNVAGVEGVCVPVPVGEMPRAGHGTCTPEAESSCGRDGMCDGAGACRRWKLGTTCGTGTCTVATNQFVPEGQCDGNGTCVSSPAITCDPYRCQDATKCYGSCTDSSQCTGSPPTCNTAVTPGSCGPKPKGATCTQDAECQSMHCVEKDMAGNGVCCDTACTATCMSCRLAATRGTCSLVPVGQDPRMQCPAAVGADAACKPGGCDGTTTACLIKPTSTQCRAPSCNAGTNTGSLQTMCVAGGTCPAAATVDCDPYVCGATACKASCMATPDCFTGGCRNGKCATFGGSFVTNLSGLCTQTCNSGNPLEGTNGCLCPPDFVLHRAFGGYADCIGSASGTATTISFCARPMRTTKSDFGGVFATYPGGCGTSVTNPYTGAAACPGDTVATNYSMYLQSCSNTATITLCTSMTAATTTFGGAYQIDDDVGMGAFCRVPNPKTGLCTCPATTSPRLLRVLVQRAIAPTIIGSNIMICTP